MDWPQTRFEERIQVVAIVPEAQRDEPPGRGNVREKEVVLASHTAGLRGDMVETAVIRTLRREGAGTPR